MEASKNNKPVEVIRTRGVSASIFANPVKDSSMPLYKVSLKRSYLGKDGEYKSVAALARDDLPIAEMLLKRAWVRILQLEEEHWAQENNDSSAE
jgi:hypothetical protein